MTEEGGSKISIGVNITLMVFIMSIGLGYLEAGIRGAVAGAVAGAAAELLSWLGFMPVMGQVLYMLLWDKVASWITELVKVRYAIVVPYYVGLLESIVASIILVVMFLVAIAKS